MQCGSTPQCAATVFYPQTQKVRCFPLRLSVSPPPHDEKPKLITSASNPFVKHCLKLRNNSSYRRSHGSVLVVGATPIRYLSALLLYSLFQFSLTGFNWFNADPFRHFSFLNYLLLLKVFCSRIGIGKFEQ